MNLNSLLKDIDFEPTAEDMEYLEKETKEIVDTLKSNTKADVFVGGSFAKDTLMKQKKYDVDIFVRFGSEKEITRDFEKLIGKLKGYKKDKVKGSREYYSIYKNGMARFEIVPVVKVKKPQEAENVTDLSYFHVNYVKRKLKSPKEVRLAKAFFHACGVYGAESYINGFSGYGLECLVIYYGTFEKLIKALEKIKDQEIIDPEKQYKNKAEVLIELNESKLGSPLILVDPTFKERNVLAALNIETFRKLQSSVRKFLANPSKRYFEKREIDVSKLKKISKGQEFLEIELKTDRQEGDIAGTKLKKFSRFLVGELEKSFNIVKEDFEYDDNKTGQVFLVLKSRVEVVKQGPPLKMAKNVKAFKKEHKNTFEKGGKIYCKEKVGLTGKEFVKAWLGKNKAVVKQMSVTNMKV
tara:strand:+ start:3400 stop:4629 length:1230 start_codon:yes stop_codon:yes gene_type:complete